MKIETFSILAGSAVCQARCPFCVSKMTAPLGVELKEPEVNWRNFKKACEFAKTNGVTTAMFTGKGEPTLFPGQITKFMEAMEGYEFPFIELQTNGLKFAEKPAEYIDHLGAWYRMGMTLAAISVVHWDAAENRKIYTPYRDTYPELAKTIALLHSIGRHGSSGQLKGLAVRLSCVMLGGYLDTPEKIDRMIQFARDNQVEQLTFTPVNKPEEENSRDPIAYKWISENYLPEENRKAIVEHVSARGSMLLELPHGARVFDVGGQNVCLSQCLTLNTDPEKMRNLIFFPDGSFHYDWQYPGAVLL